jgi:hypothetical protein
MHYLAIRDKFINGNHKDCFDHFQALSPAEKEKTILIIQSEDHINLACFLLNKLTK